MYWGCITCYTERCLVSKQDRWVFEWPQVHHTHLYPSSGKHHARSDAPTGRWSTPGSFHPSTKSQAQSNFNLQTCGGQIWALFNDL